MTMARARRQDLDIRVINAATGQLIRELVLNAEKEYQPPGQRKHRDAYVGPRCPRCLATSHV
jgi:hypothetical protein